ncbi:MAG: hypothetical protein PHV98_00665 [Candidatus Omnitrophica bacterium]|nr:hypothetical protein [Candidatus Omnitrophota bacterium]
MKNYNEFKKKVISAKNLPPKLPVTITIIIKLCIDYYQIPPVWQGVIFVVLAFYWIATIIAFFSAQYVDIFEGKNDL